ncbi:MAG: thiol:disulfide interchange protein DsbA/DsbL [Castellaniella sp.]|uniref:thiol:disulfide interchange protein DsbA/DsbL n=1 Tax=Castellaniella sp. TaxID=1955812 RepID=UPI002A363707|nr:thiol:disulfide interchange protein DsbA/DsbL [Castellaniella sp.]MDY0308307.1 thiol:disulfide interchange protein DsbA/DsbL [Castellaniella sp.]
MQTSLFSRLISGLVLGLAALAMAPAQAAPYDTLDPVQPSDTPGKIEVLEFFFYTCPHCHQIEPLIEQWRKTLPEGVAFKSVPVAFNAGMRDMQKLYYTLEALDRLDLQPAVFKAIHEDNQDLTQARNIIDWAVAQGLDRQTFTDTFNSFGVQTKVTRADELTRSYHVEGTPAIAIGGRYRTSPAQTGTYQGAIDEADKLVKQLLAGKQ